MLIDMKRFTRVVLIALVAGSIAGASGYFGMRVGRVYEVNQRCCGIPRWHNLAISAREVLGLLRFPSQVGQDRWIAEAVFPGVRDGFFLDVGSGDGIEGSNTWALEQRGWRGVCVDPFPTNMAGRTCQMVREAVDSVGGRSVVFAMADEVGGISEYLGRWKDAADAAPTTTLTTVTLDDVLRRVKAPRYIHFMSVDVEGAELEALRGFPFDRHALGALAIEHNYEEPKRSEIESLLKRHGYGRVRMVMQDDFYLPQAR